MISRNYLSTISADWRTQKFWILSCLGLSVIVISLGAFTRLTDSGLGCPDWPGCFGYLIPHGINPQKAWIEMIHRYFAGCFGILLIYLVWKLRASWLARSLILLVAFQAILGMWTVTFRLYPIMVVGHLLGGISILSVLWLLYLEHQSHFSTPIFFKSLNQLALERLFLSIGLILTGFQIFLGGWMSANYAALVCLDFPTCQGAYFPKFDFKSAFELFNAGYQGSPGERLSYTALVTIHMLHRYLAFGLLFVLGGYAIWRKNIWLISLLIIQIILGIINIMAFLPIGVAMGHQFGAVLIWLTVIKLLYENIKFARLF